MDNGSRTTWIEAVVTTAEAETTYLRAGSGAAVILLLDGGGGSDGRTLLQTLSVGFRVFMPRVTVSGDSAVRCGSTTADALAWLRGVIDALGVENPLLAADDAFAAIAARFADVDPARTGGVVPVSGADHAAIVRRLTAFAGG